MSFVVYNKETTKTMSVRARSANMWKDTWKSEGAAKAALTREAKKGKINKDDYAIAEIMQFRTLIEKQVERTNIMSGEKYIEPINTPGYMSPSSEAYWSM
jgi:hypothetical protein